jgi:hypothetical protein
MLTGSCLCGSIQFEIDGKLGPAGYCHCGQCRKANGSAFAANAPVRRKDFTLSRGAHLIREFESSPGKLRAFCSSCGSPIYGRLQAEPERLNIRLGTLDQDPGRRPLAHVWVSSRAPWYTITDDLPQFATGLVPDASEPVGHHL